MINDIELITSYISDHKLKKINSSSGTSIKNRIISFVSKLIKTRQFYDQVRFISSDGMELIRINNKQGSPIVVEEKKLQDKSNRYYFKAVKYISKNSAYISPLDWNMEGGKLEYPLKATIRIVKPIYQNTQFMGAVAINYHAHSLINQLYGKATYSQNNKIFLINNSGYSAISPVSLTSPSTDKTSQSKLIQTKAYFNQEKPKLWQTMLKKNSGHYYNENLLYTYSQINPPLFQRHKIPPLWIVSSTIKINYSQLWYLIPLYTVIGILVFFASSLFAYFHQKNRQIQTLHQYAESYRQVLKKIQLAAITINQNGDIEFCNDFFLSLTRFSKDQLVSKSFMKVCIPEKLRHQLQNKINQAFFQQQSFRHYTTLLKCSDESVKIVNWTITYSPALTHHSHSVTLVGEDITAQVINEDQLLRLSHVVDQSPFGVILTDPKGIVVYANDTYMKMAEKLAVDVINKPAQLLNSELDPDLKEIIFQDLHENQHWTGEVKLNKTHSTQHQWVRLAISTIKEQDQVLYIAVLLQDINEEKRLAKQVQQESQKRQTSEKLAAIGQASTTIAHDLRNPLCSIKMALQMSQHHYAKQENKSNELFSIALEQISYMEKTLDDLLSFSRPEKLTSEWTSIKQIIESTLSCQHKLIKESHVVITLNIENNSPHIFADTTKLRRILQNLLVNAIQATYILPITKRNITIKAKKQVNNSNQFLQIVIENNGETINKADLNKVFQPFYTTKNKGTGLGLAIVNQLTLQHQGSITLEPMQPLGTRAILYLPIDYTRVNKQSSNYELPEAIAMEQ
ncbi:PAS domain-containing protein [Endozoicomonas sp. SM1973]|uniref:histidine kinase n=1 Tax=Spartinivicinus marinus TaxID=2994442 RepID=A0A853I4B6_9GAMM|nr:PAS domain-containing sensor histidine kinase [Spartinivicinus marinus]MCX4027446.1 PAS domain-containing protein [Spartinivicinus marinus]NYZ66382.1 PAS domain-containing protein [Spartinivicinus marinus]